MDRAVARTAVAAAAVVSSLAAVLLPCLSRLGCQDAAEVVRLRARALELAGMIVTHTY
ncbi:hypothetical protein OHB54_46810 (plasmid) [Streptomyces sp. NBC_01007]|nr:hypothetical protein OHB54_46810 [Streptomyces sp. NBC_01007]